MPEKGQMQCHCEIKSMIFLLHQVYDQTPVNQPLNNKFHILHMALYTNSSLNNYILLTNISAYDFFFSQQNTCYVMIPTFAHFASYVNGNPLDKRITITPDTNRIICLIRDLNLVSILLPHFLYYADDHNCSSLF